MSRARICPRSTRARCVWFTRRCSRASASRWSRPCKWAVRSSPRGAPRCPRWRAMPRSSSIRATARPSRGRWPWWRATPRERPTWRAAPVTARRSSPRPSWLAGRSTSSRASGRPRRRGSEDSVRSGIDLSLIPGERAGGGQYAYQLAAALARVDGHHDYRLYPVFYYIVHPEYARAAFPTSERMRLAFRHLPSPLVRWLWRAKGSTAVKEWLLGPVDLVHSTTLCVPRLSPRKRLVVTIYDVSFVTHPEFHLEANIRHCLAGTRQAIDRADANLAISAPTRR